MDSAGQPVGGLAFSPKAAPLGALNKPEWVQRPASGWPGLFSQSCPGALQVRAACTGPGSKEGLTETRAGRLRGTRLGQPWESGQGHGPPEHGSPSLSLRTTPPPTGRAMGRLLWLLALPPWLHSPVQPAGVGWPRHPFKCLLAARTFNLSLLGRM